MILSVLNPGKSQANWDELVGHTILQVFLKRKEDMEAITVTAAKLLWEQREEAHIIFREEQARLQVHLEQEQCLSWLLLYSQHPAQFLAHGWNSTDINQIHKLINTN